MAKCKIMLIVGETSGDSHAAKLVVALRKNNPNVDFEFFGAPGKKMREVGVETIIRADDFARIGLVEVAKSIPMFLKIFKKLKKVAIETKPDAIILVDFPEFNLRFAKALKKYDPKIIYYVSPQVWAWRQYRYKSIKKSVDLLLTILPFEKDWYAERGFHKVKYIGNPLSGELEPKLTRKEFCEKHNLDNSKKIIALLPGSRRTEIERNLPIIIETAGSMSKKDKTLQFVIPLASDRKIVEVENVIAKLKKSGFAVPINLLVVKNETYETINAANVAAVASGTATLETAIIGTPLVVVYKVSNFTYNVLRHFVSVENVSLVNIVAQKKLVREFIQDDFTVQNLSQELFALLNRNNNSEMRNELGKIKDCLGIGGASAKAAKAIMKELQTKID